MDLKRRFLLKGALASGAGSLLLGSGLAHSALSSDNRDLSHNAAPTLLLTSDAAAETSFAGGAKVVLTDCRELRTDQVDALSLVNKAMQSGQPLRLIGLVDDAFGELIVAQARRAGARMSWLGHHAADAHQTRHQVMNNHNVQGAILSLNEQLAQSSDSYLLRSEEPFSASENLEVSRYRAGAISTDWAASLGHALAAPKIMVNNALLPVGNKPLQGRFISFIIEV